MLEMDTILLFQHVDSYGARLRTEGITEFARQVGWNVQSYEETVNAEQLREINSFWNPIGAILSPNNGIEEFNASLFSPESTVLLDSFPPTGMERFSTVITDSSTVVELAARELLGTKCASYGFVSWPTRLEEELHASISNEVLLKLLSIEKSLVYFTTSLKADTIALARANTARQLTLSEDDSDQLEDAMVEYQQALETANIHANILNGTLDTFASLINNNLNNVMKYLTVVTIFLAVPTLITSAYGMNIKLPGVDGEGDPSVFLTLVAISACAAGLIGLILFVLSKKRRF